MKTINIKGKEYVEVNERIKYFRTNKEEYPKGQILTSIERLEDGVCVMRAEVYVNDQLVSTGHAYEKEGSTFINKTSYIENCETSAIGRALGILGIGIDTSIASSEEVQNAIKQQNSTPKKKAQSNPPQDVTSLDNLDGANITLAQKDKILQYVKSGLLDGDGIRKHYKVNSFDELSFNQAIQIIERAMKKKEGK